MTDTQYFFLQQWAAGHFEPGSAPETHPGQALTRAVLENCVGGALSPGIETTWIARDPAIYAEPFRIRPRLPTPDPLSLGSDPVTGLEPATSRATWPCHGRRISMNAPHRRSKGGSCGGGRPSVRPRSYLPAGGKTGEAATPASGLGPQVPWIGSDEDPTARDYFAFADHLEMLRNWDKLGFVLDVGKPGDPRFVGGGAHPATGLTQGKVRGSCRRPIHAVEVDV